MVHRWHVLLCVSALYTVSAGGFSANRAQAQHCHHGGGSMGTPNPAALQMLMQQQLLQQQRLLQQQLIQQTQYLQQQALQAQVLQNQVRELAAKKPEEINAALKAAQPERRWAAALVIGESEPSLTEELIGLLTDDNPYVRQAARQGLVRISTRMTEGEGTAGTRPRVDFGPAATANRAAQRSAARKWQIWLAQHKQSLPGTAVAVKAGDGAAVMEEVSAARLGKELVQASADQRRIVLEKLRDSKGAAFTEALAGSIPELTGASKTAARAALAERMSRMTVATLRGKLSDEHAEARRAAALACAMKEARTLIPDLIALLQDRNAAVPPAARAALRSLTKQDFGPVSASNPAEQTRIAADWTVWWKAQSELARQGR